VSQESRQYFLENAAMLGHILGIYDNIVQEVKTSIVDEVAKNFSNLTLNGCGTVFESKWEYEPLIVSVLCYECSLWYVVF
jgi:hypothetical protein